MYKKITTQEFIKRAIKIHQYLYDYSHVEYQGFNEKVKIECKVHGIFEQIAHSHLSGNGCIKCRHKNTTKTLDQFVKEASVIFNNFYDYSISVYKNNKTKISIICPVHGKFEQEPSNHLRGYGCRKCIPKKPKKSKNIKLKPKTMDTSMFIEKCVRLHKNKYNYLKTVFIDRKTRVTITCEQHGDFSISPIRHMRGSGCEICRYEERHTMLLNVFKEKASKIYNNEYSYDLIIDYKNNSQIVPIVCKRHGVFTDSVSYHLKGVGCPKCRTRKPPKNKLTNEIFVKRANEVHKNRYNYSLVNYTGIFSKVDIICPFHGKFSQRAHDHLGGKSCKKCFVNRSKECAKWLDTFNIPEEFREIVIYLSEKKYVIVDGFDPITNTVYEFFGSFWHGNPEFYNPNDINPRNGKTYGELYKRAMKKVSDLESEGYNVVYVWGKGKR
jgi:hypothetical protein